MPEPSDKGLPVRMRRPSGYRGCTSQPKWLTPAITCGLVLIATVYLVHWARRDGLDLQVYRAGIATWLGGHNPYDGVFTVHRLSFTYPPFALLALSPLEWAPFATAQVALWLLSIGALAVAVYVICGRGGRKLLAQSLGWACLAVLVVEPVRTNLDYGQVNTLLLCMIVVDLLFVPRGHRGWLIGLAAAIKLTPLVFLAIPLLERDWKTLSRGMTGALGATGLMWLWPNVSRTYWTKDVFDVKRVGGVVFVGNQSLNGLLHRWPFPSSGEFSLWVVTSVATLIMGLYVARRSLGEGRSGAAILSLAFVGLLISPISWTHHWVWVALIPPVLLKTPKQVPSRSVRAGLWLLFTVSVLEPYWWFPRGTNAHYLGDSLVLLAFILLVVWSTIEYRSQSRADVHYPLSIYE
jgi:alpha-1,2-mannosyltransferase